MVKKEDEESISSETKGPLKSFQALMGEGEKFSRDKLYIKAIQCYTEALDLLPQDDDKSSAKDINDRLNGLVARSACYLKIGKNDLALQDSEESLKSNKEFTKGLYQKAEALYAMGEFELALMFYHRGKKLRSDLREFQLGINKAQEAIDNSVGDPNRVKLEASGDLSIFYKNEEKKKQPMGYIRASQKKEAVVQRKQHPTPANPKTTKQLLGDLYEDRAFLEKIINNSTVTKQNTKTGDAIYQLASDGLDYLDSRTDFWRQQEPLYARSKFSKKPEGDDETYKHIRRELEAIDEQQNMDQFPDARRRAHRLLDFCERLDEKKFNEKQSVLSDVYSRLGNAYLELGDYNKSLEYHNRDLRISESKNFNEKTSRALDNLGRVYARSGQFPQAIQVWERKIPLATSPLEKAWLFHEIGQCHFGLGDYERSKRYGERSYTEAVEVKDPIWQLNAKVLVAHSETKLRQYRDAEHTFDEALVLAKDQRDVAAEKAIERAAKEVRDQIAKGAADSPPDRNEINYEIKVKSTDNIVYEDEGRSAIHLTIFGDNGSSGPIDLRGDEHDSKKFNGQSVSLKKKAFDAGKLTKIALTCKHVDSWPLESIEVVDTKRKTKLKFLLPQPLDSATTIADLYPEGSIVPPITGSTGKDDKKSKTPATTSQQSPSTMKRTDTAPSSARTNDTSKKADEQKDQKKAKGEEDKRAKDEEEKHAKDEEEKRAKAEEEKRAKAEEEKRAKAEEEKRAKAEEEKRAKEEEEKRAKTNEEISTPEPNQTTASTSDSQKKTQYIIAVQTGNIRSAGTDANVYVSLYGDKSKIVRQQLKKSKSANNPFERDQRDEFEFDDNDIGKLKTINIEHDGTGIASGWYVEYVEVKINDQTTKFPVERWLDINEGDKRISLDLEPNKKPESKVSAADSNTGSKVEYEITVKTGDKRGAGTDADVYLSIYGDKDKLERRELKDGRPPPQQSRNVVETTSQFEKGGTDYFQIFGADVGKIKTIRIEHDGTGIGAGWYIDSIEIRHASQNQTYKFPVDRWLDVGEGDKRISLDLEPDKKPGQLTNNNTIQQKANAEKDAKAKAEADKLAKAEEEKRAKAEKEAKAKDDDEKRAKAEKEAKAKAEEEKRVKAEKEAQAKAEDEKRAKAEKEAKAKAEEEKRVKAEKEAQAKAEKEAQAKAEKEAKAKAEEEKRVKAEKEAQAKAEKEAQAKAEKEAKAKAEEEKRVKAEKEAQAKAEEEKRLKEEKEAQVKAEKEKRAQAEKEAQAKAEAEKPAIAKQEAQAKAETNQTTRSTSDSQKKPQYTVICKTGSKIGSGTDANVFISLYGDKNKILRRELKKPKGGWNPFEKDQTDEFEFDDHDIGKLKTINIEHDGTGMGSGWYVEYVEVKVKDQVTKFPVERWLDINEGDKRISLDLEPNKKPGAKISTDSNTGSKVEYEVTIKTGDKRGAGTDANVYLSIYGDKDKFERRELKDGRAPPQQSQNAVETVSQFEKGGTDYFQIYGADVGKIKTIRIEHDGTGIGAGWYIDSVEVRHVSKNQTYKFPVDRWLDVGEGDKRISLDLEPDKKPGQLQK